MNYLVINEILSQYSKQDRYHFKYCDQIMRLRILESEIQSVLFFLVMIKLIENTSVLGRQLQRCCGANFTNIVFLKTLSISTRLVHNNFIESQGGI